MVRCVCADITFAEIQASGVKTLADAALWFGAGEGCGLCRPYLKRMFETGETEFPILSPNDDAFLLS